MRPPPPPPDDRDALIAAWLAWDARPADKGTANRYADRCHGYAGPLSNQLRIHLANALGRGLSRSAALTEWDLDHEPP